MKQLEECSYMSAERTEMQMEDVNIPQPTVVETSSPGFRLGVLIVVLAVFAGLFGFAMHERNVAQQLTSDNQQTSAALKDTRAQMDALNAKLDGLINTQQQQTKREAAIHVSRAHAVVRHAKPDPRWAKFQAQLDSQGKAIDETRQDLASTRTDLSGSIAKNHDELVALQRKGERNYFEFDLEKSKQFAHTGPFGISLRKANTKHQFADLELLVDDRDISKKHLNLYEPVVFYPDDEHQPLELVINSITKNHIHGYISAPKYRASELTAMANGSDPQAVASNTISAPATPQLRRR